MDTIQHAINLIPLLIAFVMILWGLRLFKIGIIIIGIIIGGAIGAGLGGLIGFSLQHEPQEAALGAAIVGLLLAIVGGKIAWPLKKLFVFLSSGLIIGFIGAVLSLAVRIPIEGAYVIGIIFFVIGGIVAMRLYEYFIVASMSFFGAQIIFNIIHMPSLGFYGFNLAQLSEELLRVCSRFIVSYLFTISPFLLFGIYFQKIKAIKPDDNEEQKQRKICFRRITYLYSIIVIFAYLFGFFTRAYIPSWIDSSHKWIYSSTVIFGINILSWPIVSLVTFWFLRWLNEKGYKHTFTSNIKLTKLAYIAGFGLIVVPRVTDLTSHLIFGCSLLPYYNSYFLRVPLGIIKLAFSIFIFPFLVYYFVLKKQEETKEVHKETKTAKEESLIEPNLQRCAKCGFKISAEANFCRGCGAKLKQRR